MAGFGGFDSAFSGFGILFIIVFILIAAVIAVLLVRGIGQWRKNNASPRLTVDARVVSRRSDTHVSNTPVAGDATGAHGFSTSSHTVYYATFEVESGDRMEFSVPQSEYGYLAEGDFGRLTFQGTRFIGFQRI